MAHTPGPLRVVYSTEFWRVENTDGECIARFCNEHDAICFAHHSCFDTPKNDEECCIAMAVLWRMHGGDAIGFDFLQGKIRQEIKRAEGW